MKTKYGTIEMYCLEEWLTKNKIDFQPIKFRNDCHHAVAKLASNLQEDYITTSEFASLFGGFYYHSYYTLKNGDGVVDPSRNIFYSENCYQEVFKPNVLLQYPAKEFYSRYQAYLRQELQEDKGLDAVIALALNQKRKALK